MLLGKDLSIFLFLSKECSALFLAILHKFLDKKLQKHTCLPKSFI